MAAIETCVYVSGACNQSPRCIDWWNELICYGSCNSVLIYDPQAFNGAGIIKNTLSSHQNTVNCVKWIRDSIEVELLSGSVDKTIILWRKLNDKYVPKQVLNLHQGSVAVVDCIVIKENEQTRTILASASADSTVKIWERLSFNDDFECMQTIAFGYGFALDVRLTELPKSKSPLLAVAGDNSKVNLYTKNDEVNVFEIKLVLSGHEDWVRGLDFAKDDNGNLLLVSSSQDAFLRLWRISKENNENFTSNSTIKLKENLFTTGKQIYSVMLESVMAGHENWVYSVHWQPPIQTEYCFRQPLRVISASMDKTLILWELDDQSNLWSEKARVGDIGGNSLGFYNAIFSPDGTRILAHGYQGSFHIWNYNMEIKSWEPSVALRGHFGEVLDIIWDPKGQFLLSCSDDKTTRLHACWKQDSENISWHEIARPQIHGYEMTCLGSLGQLKFASGADEKIIRIFAAPRNFVENFKLICQINFEELSNETIPEGASVPSLGLSNKAVFTNDLQHESDPDDRHIKDQYPEYYFSPLTLSKPPTEDVLLQNTLWPETQKLYGHGYEIFCLAGNHSGTLLASACKASKTEHAAVIIWDVVSWKQLCQLEFHSLTVTQMAFSPNDKFLLTVSRDRTWALYAQKSDNSTNFIKVANSDKKMGVHTRIIWGCAWSHDSQFFATVSRDKKVVMWEVALESNNSSVNVRVASVPLQTEDSATAIDFAPCTSLAGRFLVGIGLQNGVVLLYSWKQNSGNTEDWDLCFRLDQQLAHHLTVKRLKFSPKQGRAGYCEDSKNYLQMATCGSDHLVRVYNLNLMNLK